MVLVLSCNLSYGKVLFVCDPYPPFTYEREGKLHKGVIIELLAEILIGISEYETKSIEWHTALKLLEKGRADITGPLFKTLERSEYLVYTEPLYLERFSICYLSENSESKFSNITNIVELYNEKVGVVKDFYYGEELNDAIRRNYVRAVIVKYASTNLKILLRGRVDAAIFNETVVRNLISSNPDVAGKVECSSVPIDPMQLHFGISKKSVLLDDLDLINARILDLKSKSYLKKLRDKYSLDRLKISRGDQYITD
ncbi:hypothetical protein A9Q84_15820 [Halobacteriovorax marinus]|uniref:Solute-binding protein family 3/N-terminal domain-containing protein n=1 Tax=Halobacteriovorax marinus TaxID=97084 RepID=A0A1Y5F4H9_9BACT|nr:hypothetical protein A9Q84_15820 [Halobacteriovorax marinus]